MPGPIKTLWFNTGSRCNIACENCYIESTPTNDRLAYLTVAEISSCLDEAGRARLPIELIGLTGGEPFLNRDIIAILNNVLGRGFRALVLTNAMKPMQRRRDELAALHARHGEALTLRVSLDYYDRDGHERVRGPGTWEPAVRGLHWLVGQGFQVDVAGRLLWDEEEAALRAGYAAMFSAEGIPIDASDPASLVLFPEMNLKREVPEITTHCWDVLSKSPDQMMCASSRMVLKRTGAATPVVVPCTLLPYDQQFELGTSLASASTTTVRLNHPFCAQFCVLGGASCSSR